MSSLIKDTIKFEQFDIECYMIKMNPQELIDFTTVAIFDPKNPGDFGYQRPLNLEHANQIAQYLMNNQDPIMLSTFLCAINDNEIDYRKNQININSKLRILDGQHRIEGLKLVSKYHQDKFDKIKNQEYAVVIAAMKQDQEVYEISTFIDINSKSKRVSTDLAIQLRSKIREKKSVIGTMNYDLQGFIEEILNRVVKNLNKDETSVWYEAYKDATNRNGIISVNAFINSLRNIVKKLIRFNNLEDRLTIANIDSIEKEITKAIKDIWEIIFERWHGCFNHKRFNKQYNIQKGIGVNALHILFTKIMEINDLDLISSINTFESIIQTSYISEKDWLVSGPFAQYSSSAGYKELSRIIENGILG